MMFVNRFVGCVKVDGNILREDNGVVTLPFGAEFSILLKNLNSLRATAKVSVDGTDATEGTSLVIPANGSVELERFIRSGNLNSGNRFKFIERTAGIEAHKGIGAEDGLIRIEFHAEVQPAVHQTVIHHHVDWYPRYPHPYEPWRPHWTLGCNSATYTAHNGDATFGANAQSGGLGQITNTAANMGSASRSSDSAAPGAKFSGGTKSKSGSPLRSMKMSLSAAGKGSGLVRSAALNDAGITVPGSESSQGFTRGAWFATESVGHVLVLQLRGTLDGRVVIKPVTVKTKPTCASCGKGNKPLDKFCGECGTSLNVI